MITYLICVNIFFSILGNTVFFALQKNNETFHRMQLGLFFKKSLLVFAASDRELSL